MMIHTGVPEQKNDRQIHFMSEDKFSVLYTAFPEIRHYHLQTCHGKCVVMTTRKRYCVHLGVQESKRFGENKPYLEKSFLCLDYTYGQLLE